LCPWPHREQEARGGALQQTGLRYARARSRPHRAALLVPSHAHRSDLHFEKLRNAALALNNFGIIANISRFGRTTTSCANSCKSKTCSQPSSSLFASVSASLADDSKPRTLLNSSDSWSGKKTGGPTLSLTPRSNAMAVSPLHHLPYHLSKGEDALSRRSVMSPALGNGFGNARWTKVS